MGLGMLQGFGLVLKVCAFAWILVDQGSAVPPIGDRTPSQVPNANVPIGISPAPIAQPNRTGMLAPQVMSPPESAPGPQTMKGLPPPIWPSPSMSPPSPFVPPPAHNNGSVPPGLPPHNPPFTVEAPAPVVSPSNSSPPTGQIHPAVPESAPPKAPASNAPLAASPPPATNAATPTGIWASPPPSPPVLPGEPPSIPPDVSTHPALPGNSSPVKPMPLEPLFSPPAQRPPQVLAPPPSFGKKATPTPFAAPPKRTTNHYTPVSQFPAQAPTASKPVGNPNSAPPPQRFPKSSPVFRSPNKHHRSKMYPAPVQHTSPPTSGYFQSAPPNPSAFPSSNNHYSSISPSPSVSPPWPAKTPLASPKISPMGLSPRSPRTQLPPPLQALPPPPPNTDCTSLKCQEPLAYGPPQSPCVCVLPIQVGLRLTVSLYTFFPLVSELAAEIAAGVFIKQSQVRIMGANTPEGDPDRTVAHIDLLPLGRKFEDTTAYMAYQRFWNKQVAIKTSFFGNYDVLYVQYPGLPPSPPLPPSTIGVIANKPYPGHDNNTRTMQPLGVDISREQHKHGPSGSMLAAIIISCFVALTLLCAVVWVLIFRHQHCIFWSDPTAPSTIRSLAKSSGIPVSTVGSGPSSPTFSLGSNIAACTGSARTFSLSDIERATDFFNEMRIIGEGGFGRVYSGVLEDGTKVAFKILKRSDQQGDREFMAEVEMLSRLHHRNLVKLIGICVQERTRCLVYELITNGSVESHLHGIDKERSPLDWTARLKIALGAARALAYLHEDSYPRVIHRDFKASNILLEDDFTPKVSDFGLARSALDEESQHISTRVMGTFGYLAPEYAMTGHLLVKSDVYSYGVVLLELLTGRKPVDMSQPPGQENLVSWVRPLLTHREDLESIIDPSLGPDFPFDSVVKVAAIASMCVQPEVSHRPFMGEVVQALRLVSNECSDETQDVQSRGSSHDDFSIILGGQDSDSAQSDRLVEALLTPSSINGYNYELDVESEISLSELLSSAANAGAPTVQDSESPSFRRYLSSSGPIRTSKTKQIWKTVRQLSTMPGTVSEHRVLRRLWPGSH